MTRQFSQFKSAPETQGSGRVLQPLAAIRRYWKLSVAAAFAVLLLGLPAAWWKGSPKYRTEGALFVSPRFLRNLDGDPEHELQSNSQYREFVQQQVRTVNRYDIVAATLQAGSPMATAWQKPDESARRATDRLRAALQVLPVPDTYQVTVALEGEKPEGLAELVNAVMQSYVRTAHKELLFDSETRLKNLEQERQELRSDIEGRLEERSKIARDLGTTVFSGALVNSFDRQLGSSVEALMEARRQRFVAEAEQRAGGATAATALQNALSDSSLNGFKSALNQRKAELLISIHGLTPLHSARLAAEKEIAAIDRTLETMTNAMRDRLAANLETIHRSRAENSSQVEQRLVAETKQIREQADSYSRGYQRSLELGEEIDRTRKRLNAVEDRIRYLQLETKAPGFVRIFSPAMTPILPFEGGRKKLALLVLAAALGLALCIPLALDFMDPKLRAPAELEMHLGLPITGWIPASQAASEASLLRAAVAIRRHVEELKTRCVVLTAVDHGGGSSTVALGMGNALNRLGVRTLVVEANPLTPDRRYAGASRGLIEFLKSGGEIPLVPRCADVPDRVATGAGSVYDLLPVERIAQLTGQRSEPWDLVLIDAAPVNASVATEEMVRVLGAAVLIVDAQRDSRKAVTACLKKIERLSPDAFGAVLNKVIPNDPTTLLAA